MAKSEMKIVLLHFQNSFTRDVSKYGSTFPNRSMCISKASELLIFHFKKHMVQLAVVKKPFVCKARPEPPLWFLLGRASVFGGATTTFTAGVGWIYQRHKDRLAKEEKAKSRDEKLKRDEKRHEEVMGGIAVVVKALEEEQSAKIEALEEVNNKLKGRSWWKLW